MLSDKQEKLPSFKVGHGRLRSGFAERDIGKFTVSIALVGMRDIKDYLTAAKDGTPVNPGSPFNIKNVSSGKPITKLSSK
ncbi:hypothetical protein [Leadbettera azotonutricia]|uniref:Uncharacterized protein n=1 Tax=Leadbettera azotonutricia (strain ATCC BAA-888 / DSM 13862 / ZAS-9) TaxID=545695 RepID=F5YAU6_LEAAZ|nr:hypothetical protein [Leadbettera azotonutricia]AEF81710.1 conserved hypothetical protein [Leadbettera azotonutricia ZAS-9]